jgi:hypothetical protein
MMYYWHRLSKLYTFSPLCVFQLEMCRHQSQNLNSVVVFCLCLVSPEICPCILHSEEIQRTVSVTYCPEANILQMPCLCVSKKQKNLHLHPVY